MYRVAFFLPLPLRFSRSPRCPRSLALLAAAVLLDSVGRRPLSCIRILIQTLFTRLCAPLRFFCVVVRAWAVLADRCAVWVRRASVYVATRARDGRPGSMDVPMRSCVHDGRLRWTWHDWHDWSTMLDVDGQLRRSMRASCIHAPSNGTAARCTIVARRDARCPPISLSSASMPGAGTKTSRALPSAGPPSMLLRSAASKPHLGPCPVAAWAQSVRMLRASTTLPHVSLED